jgi:thiamine-phosphate diphosphorylase
VICHFVTDRRRFALTCDDVIARAAAAARRGVDVVQIRERDLSDDALMRLVRGVIDVVSGTRARVIVSDRADIALAARADGVHLPADAVAASRIRAFVPAHFLIGRSVHTLDEIDRAAADGGCNYLLFGTVFRSSGKPAGHTVAGIDALRDACARSPLPVIAIGGITDARATEVAAAGAAGLAAVGMFM